MAAFDSLTKVSNADLWNLCRRFSPTFKSHTAEATADLFTARGFEALARDGLNLVNEFIEISLRVAFQRLDVETARNPLRDGGLVEVYSTPNGGYVQRMSVSSIKPISPGFIGVENGQGADPFLVRKPETKERFFQQNFSYQNLISLQDFQIKQIFISERGMGAWLAGVLKGLETGYTVQEYTNTLECLNAALHSDTYPLKDTELITLSSWTGEGTAGELREFILTAKDIASAMTSVSQTGMYNPAGFKTAPNPSDFVMLVRPGIKNRIAVNLEVGAFHPDRLSLPFEVVETAHFGGLIPYTDENFETLLYPKYSSIGEQVGWNTVEDGTGTDYNEADVYYKDPNEQIVALLCQKGLIFENVQNPYTVQPIYNPRNMVTSYWANKPNNGIVWDPYYNIIAIMKPDSE